MAPYVVVASVVNIVGCTAIFRPSGLVAGRITGLAVTRWSLFSNRVPSREQK